MAALAAGVSSEFVWESFLAPLRDKKADLSVPITLQNAITGGAKCEGLSTYIAKAKHEGEWQIAQLAYNREYSSVRCEATYGWKFYYTVDGNYHSKDTGEVLCATSGQVCILYLRITPGHPIPALRSG